MCGICGYYAKNRIPDEVLREMNDTMAHRGPDDDGVWSVQMPDCAVGFAQRRLSIIDLSPLGHQPMFSSDERIVIVFNGEIYNYREVREELKQNGCSFRSECDTEVILQGYVQWGDAVLKKLNGMFAFVLYDRCKNRLFMARDRIGKKPFYYYWDGESFVFASELKPLMRYPGFVKKIRTEVLARYLCTGYINEPDTIFENTFKLEAGGYLVLEENRLCREKYWDLLELYDQNSRNLLTDYNDAKEELENLLEDSVGCRMIADVPTGTLLSGGIDSSLMTALAVRNSVERVRTYAIGFEQKEFNEAVYARKVADFLGTEHTELYLTEKDAERMLDKLCLYYDEPFADSSQIATMLVSELAKKDITVALSGDGGDELFCGYGFYDVLRKRQSQDGMAGLAYRLLTFPGIAKFHLIDKMPDSIQGVLYNRDPGLKVQFHLTKLEKKALTILRGESAPVKDEREKVLPHDDWQIAGMLLDMLGYLPNGILAKVDRASMKYALESRCPILDYRVVEYSFRLPHAFKYRNGEKKYILKDILYESVPRELFERPKSGFAVPIGKWMRGILREKILEYSTDEYLARQGIFRSEETRGFLLDYLNGASEIYQRIVWGYYIFQEWYAEYMR